LAAVQSLVETGSFEIEESMFQTPDKALIGGRFYSDKPPLLNVLLSGIYGVLHHGLGLSFRDPETHHLAIYLLNLLGIGSLSLLLAGLFFHRLGKLDLGLWERTALAAGALVTTWVLSYGVTINNHTPAALAAFLTFVALEKFLDSRSSRWALAAGLAAGLLMNFELPAGLLAVGGMLTIWAAGGSPSDRGSRWRSCGAFALGFGFFLLVLAGLNLWAHGSILPAYLVPGAYDFPGNIHSQGYAGLRTPGGLPAYILGVTFGLRGVFSHMPALLFAAIGFVVLRSRPRRALLPFLSSGVAYAIFYVLQTGDFGGWAYGFRYLLLLVPILYWYAAAGYAAKLQTSSRRARIAWRASFFSLLTVGLVTSLVGAYNPWPICYEGTSTNEFETGGLLENLLEERVHSPFLGNLFCWSYERDLGEPWQELLGKAAIRGEERHKETELLYLGASFANLQRPELERRVHRQLQALRAERRRPLTPLAP